LTTHSFAGVQDELMKLRPQSGTFFFKLAAMTRRWLPTQEKLVSWTRRQRMGLESAAGYAAIEQGFSAEDG
jgi:hypothetical protein